MRKITARCHTRHDAKKIKDILQEFEITVNFGEDSGRAKYDIAVIENNMQSLVDLKKRDPRAEVIVIGETEGDAIEAIKHGAFALFTYPIDTDGFRSSVRDIVEMITTSVKAYELETQLLNKYTFAGMVVGKSIKMQTIFSLLRRIAPYYSSVLITGETGTGKEVIAKTLHKLSTPDKPFTVCNCGGLTESLVESMLFGHKKGAFTGATTDRKGLFEIAGDGCIFLDEIGELPLSFQPHFLRVLHDGEYRPIGASTIQYSKCRVIAATNRSLPAEVEQGRFRKDLYYRLAPLTIELPPLRDRKEDILILSHNILEGFNARSRKKVYGVSNPAKEILTSYDWPGNVRELTNVIEQAAISSEQQYIRPEDLGEILPKPSKCGPSGISKLDSVIRAHIQEALRMNGGNQTNTAKALGISRRALIRRMERYDMK